MRKDVTPLDRYEAGEDVPAIELAAQTGCAVVQVIIGAIGTIVGLAFMYGILAS